jgi:dynactin 1
MTHLSELHLRDGVESYAEEVLMKTLLMQSNLETTAAALLTAKTAILRAIPPSEDSDDEISSFVEKTDTVMMQARGAKVIVGKIIRALQELKVRSLALTSETQPNFEACQDTTENLTVSMRTLGLAIHQGIHEEDRPSPFGLSDLLTVVRDFNASQYNATDADVFAPLQAKMKKLHERLTDIYSVASDLSMTVEFERPQPPWVLRSKELKDSTVVSASAEQEISALKREIHERATALKMRDQTLDESNVKIELLEARMYDVSKKANKITELEKAIEEAKAFERKMARKMEEKMLINAKLEEERDRWMRKAAEMKTNDSSAGDLKQGGIDLVGTSAEMDRLQGDIKVLESTVRYLRQQNRRKRSEEAAQATSWLQQPLLFPPPKEELALKEKAQESFEALEKLAELPKTAKPLLLEGVLQRPERLKWRPMKSTPQYRLCEMEMQWLETSEPLKLGWHGGLGGGGHFITVG